MKITVMSANTSAVKGIKTGKGQSLLIQTGDHNFLFDFGADKSSVLKNFRTLGISSDIVGAAFLSCGDANHSGGMLSFLQENRRATAYARITAFAPRFKKGLFGMKNVAPDKKLNAKRRILRCKNYFAAKDESFVTFSLTEGGTGSPVNTGWFVKDDAGKFTADDFTHEMYLMVRADKNWALFCGDAHAGIAAVVDHAQRLAAKNLGGKLQWVIGGFSMCDEKGKPVSDEYIDAAAQTLAEKNIQYYTGHSTGEYAFNRLKNVLGDRLHSYAAGDVIEL